MFLAEPTISKLGAAGVRTRAFRFLWHTASPPTEEFSHFVFDDVPYLLKVTDLSGKETLYATSVLSGEHGGADNILRDDVFRGTRDDTLGQSANSYAGYLSLAVGDMAVISNNLKREVFIDENL